MTVCRSPNSNGRGRHTYDTFLPPTGETTAYIISPRHFYTSSATLTPPQPPMCGQPMHRLHYGPVSTSTLAPRFVGRGERHATPHTYRPVLGALRCVEKCSPASGGARLLRLTTPSSLRSFAPAPPCRAASSSPHIAVIQPLALINPRRGRAVAVVRVNFPRMEICPSQQRFYRAMVHIPQGVKGRRAKRSAGRWGVHKATTGASPRNPQLAHSSLVSNFNPLQTDKSLQRDP